MPRNESGRKCARRAMDERKQEASQDKRAELLDGHMTLVELLFSRVGKDVKRFGSLVSTVDFRALVAVVEKDLHVSQGRARCLVWDELKRRQDSNVSASKANALSDEQRSAMRGKVAELMGALLPASQGMPNESALARCREHPRMRALMIKLAGDTGISEKTAVAEVNGAIASVIFSGAKSGARKGLQNLTKNQETAISRLAVELADGFIERHKDNLTFQAGLARMNPSSVCRSSVARILNAANAMHLDYNRVLNEVSVRIKKRWIEKGYVEKPVVI